MVQSDAWQRSGGVVAVPRLGPQVVGPAVSDWVNAAKTRLVAGSSKQSLRISRRSHRCASRANARLRGRRSGRAAPRAVKRRRRL